MVVVLVVVVMVKTHGIVNPKYNHFYKMFILEIKKKIEDIM